MKKQIRQNVFETNSSSTHTLSIVTNQEWDDYKNNKSYCSVCSGDVTFISKEKVENMYNECVEKCKHEDYGCPDFEEWLDENQYFSNSHNDYYEIISKKTPDGEHIAVSIYGYSD